MRRSEKEETMKDVMTVTLTNGRYRCFLPTDTRLTDTRILDRRDNIVEQSDGLSNMLIYTGRDLFDLVSLRRRVVQY